jgi:hypothetical protein
VKHRNHLFHQVVGEFFKLKPGGETVPDIFHGPHTYQKVESTPATFHTCTPEQAPPGHGGHVHFECNEYVLPDYVRDKLDKLSIWGGNTANLPEFSFWELTDNYQEAISFLERVGFQKA